jgi:cold shock CspA family protein
MASGKVKWFDIHKGYGFISQDEGTIYLFITQILLERLQGP